MQGFEVIREVAGIENIVGDVGITFALVSGNRQQAVAFEVPQAGAVDLIDVAGAAGDQLRGFLQGVVLAITMAGQAQDQVLLGADTLQVLKLLLLGALVEFKGNLQAGVLGFEIIQRHRGRAVDGRLNHQQVAT